MGFQSRSFVVLLACAAALNTGAALAAGAAPKPVIHTVVIDGTRFEPATMTVACGDKVVWVNKDPFPHTATANGVFDSRTIAAGKSWKYKALAAGEHGYICALHPNMKGTLVVR
ncbi:MAG: cupredoxin family copper-binding protein [Betaproteobacteria bacterium]